DPARSGTVWLHSPLGSYKTTAELGRPTLGRQAFMFALRSIRKGGIYHAEFQKLLANNGGKKMSALTAISRKSLKLMFRVAREQRPFVPMGEMDRGTAPLVYRLGVPYNDTAVTSREDGTVK